MGTVSDALHDLPAYALAVLPHRTRHLLLTPATRWRVIVEDVTEIKRDVILDAVLQVRAAGESSPSRIADLLQLPQDLVRHLLSSATTERVSITSDGRTRRAESRVAWIYRDRATGELWPDPSPEVPPLRLRPSGQHRAQLVRGTAGRPVVVDCLLMESATQLESEPNAIELTRFGTTGRGQHRRTALVSVGEPCLVASPVRASPAGVAVWTTRDIPHLSLSRHLAAFGEESRPVRRWLSDIPSEGVDAVGGRPLQVALDELRALAVDQGDSPATVDHATLLGRVDLCLSRCIDQLEYSFDVAVDAVASWDVVVARSGHTGVHADDVEALANAPRGSVPWRSARLHPGRGPDDGRSELVRDLVRAAGLLLTMTSGSPAARSTAELTRQTISVCHRLIDATGGL